MKKSLIIPALLAVLLTCACNKDLPSQDSPSMDIPDTGILSAVRDGYFKTSLRFAGNEDLDQLMRSLYFSSTQSIPLTTTFSGKDKNDRTVNVDFTGNANVEIRFNIYPIHCFSSTGSAPDEGDYYFVEQVTTLCSEPAYSRKDKTIYVGKDQSKCCGFYLKGLKMNAVLCDSDGNQVGSFRQTPVPATSTGSTVHTSGFDFSLSGSFSGTSMGLPMLNGSIGYSKSSAAEISDLTVSNTHDNQGTVSFAYTIQNLPKKMETYPPAVAVHTLDLPAAWIWFVPKASGNQEYTVTMSLENIVYGCHLWWGFSYFESFSSKAASVDFSFNIPAPRRIATGTIIVKNNSKDSFFTNPEVKNVTTGETTSDTTNGAYGPGQEFSAVIPEGTYSVSFLSNGEKKTLRKQYTLKLSESGTVQAFAFDE